MEWEGVSPLSFEVLYMHLQRVILDVLPYSFDYNQVILFKNSQLDAVFDMLSEGESLYSQPIMHIYTHRTKAQASDSQLY